MDWDSQQHKSSSDDDTNTIIFIEELPIQSKELVGASIYRRTKNYYGVAQTISTVNPIDKAVISGQRAAYTKFSQVMLDNNALYKKMGFFLEGDDTAKLLVASTPVYFKTFSEASKEGLIGELTFTIVATGSSVSAFLGKSYTTSIPFSYQLPLTQIGIALKTHIFMFGKSQYKVKPGSIKEKKTKKNTPNFG